MTPTPVFLEHASSLAHDTGDHPEHADRLVAVQAELARRDWVGFRRIESPAVERSVLTRVHPPEYVQWIEEMALRGGGALDLDTVMNADSFDAALHAAGGAVRLAEMLVAGEAPTAFSAHRPPGHHASATRAMGFCLFNNIAVAARHAIDGLGLDRVMVIDWDVHHGNGTSDVFWSSPEVLFVSLHQSPFYPGTGSPSEVGGGVGEGFTVNLPVPARSDDGLWTALIAHVVVPVGRAFEPQLLLISAGYDAHELDPIGGCAVTDDGFAAMAAMIGQLGAELGVPVGCVLEGGYQPGALARCVAATMEVLGGAAAVTVAADDGAAGAPAVRAARERLARWWPALSAGA